MNYMKFSNKRKVALQICKAVVKSKQYYEVFSEEDPTLVVERVPRYILSSHNTIDQLLSFIVPLLKDDEDGGKEESYEFEEGQEFVARLVNLVYHPWQNDAYYEMLLKF